MYILIFSVFCLCTYLFCFVVILLFCVIFIFVCTNVGLLPPGESAIAVSSSSSSSSSKSNTFCAEVQLTA